MSNTTNDGNDATTATRDNVWHEAVAWIESNGGYAHPQLRYDDAARQVRLGKPSSAPPTNPSSENNNPTTVAGGLDAGTTLLEIPDACLLTLHSVEADEAFGKSLFGAVHSLQPTPPTAADDEWRGQNKKHESSNNEEEGLLFHDAQDVILALYLAYLQHQLLEKTTHRNNEHRQQPSKNNKNGNGNTTNNEATDDDDDNSNNNNGAASECPWVFHRPYLATLPQTCHLPRQWSAPTLRRRLQGTSLRRRILKEQRGVRREYDLARNAWTSSGNASSKRRSGNDAEEEDRCCGNHRPFPPFGCYDNMMAALTSRGFAGLGYDGVDALIPVFDLLNHVRGRGGSDDDDSSAGKDDSIMAQRRMGVDERMDSNRVESAAKNSETGNGGEKKCETDSDNANNSMEGKASKCDAGPDVRYERYETGKVDKADGGAIMLPSSKRQRTKESNKETMADDNDETIIGRGGVCVSAAKLLPIGSVLHMTYGAKGNVALLGRYGFCIPNNVEPDGSCNDVLELEIEPNESPVQLQRGPKAYSYGPFVKALELCRSTPNDNTGKDGNENSNDATTEEEIETNNDVHDCDGDDPMEEDNGDGGLEAFLESCDNELDEDDGFDEFGENDDDGMDDCFYATSASTINADNSSITKDLRAIDKLKGILETVKAGCVNNPLSSLKLGSKDMQAEDGYCAILIRSEIQTVEFYLAAADLLRCRLMEHSGQSPSKHDHDSSIKSHELGKDCQNDDKDMSDEQIRALVNAFISIRYPQLSK